MVMAFVLMALGAPVRAASDSLDGGGSEDQGTASKLGWGMASVGINLGYMPVKMIYALGGGLVGLLAWGFTAGDDNVLYGHPRSGVGRHLGGDAGESLGR
jgi:hypothetical protein